MKYILVFCIATLTLHGQAQEQYFPPAFSEEWETLPIDSLGWCQDQLDSLLFWLEDNNTNAFLILKDGKMVVENYFGTFTTDSLWYWASAGKTLTGFAVGMAEQEGLLALEDSSADYLGNGWSNLTSEQETAITVWNHITMTTGLDDGFGNVDCTDPECLEYLTEPGTRWAYHNAPYTIIDRIIESASGETLNGFIQSRVLTPIGGIAIYVPLGYNNVVFSRPRVMARFGHLLLNEGSWNGNQIMTNQDYFTDMTTPSQDLNQAYGYLTWLSGQDSYQIPGIQFEIGGSLTPNSPDDMFSGIGKNAQFVDVVPSMGLVVIRMGDLPNDNAFVPITFHNEMWERINSLPCNDMSIHDLESSFDVTVYPNPVSDILHVSVNNGEPASNLRLYNQLGQQIISKTASPTINVSELEPGLYFLNISYKDQEFTRKVLVE